MIYLWFSMPIYPITHPTIEPPIDFRWFQEMLASFDILRRLLGENAAEMLQRWAKTRAHKSAPRWPVALHGSMANDGTDGFSRFFCYQRYLSWYCMIDSARIDFTILLLQNKNTHLQTSEPRVLCSFDDLTWNLGNLKHLEVEAVDW